MSSADSCRITLVRHYAGLIVSRTQATVPGGVVATDEISDLTGRHTSSSVAAMLTDDFPIFITRT